MFSDNAVDATPAQIARHGEPGWLATERHAALRTHAFTPDPTNRDEVWRYTQLPRFSIAGLDLIDAPRSDAVPARIDIGLVTFAGSAQVAQRATIDRPSLVAAIDAVTGRIAPTAVRSSFAG